MDLKFPIGKLEVPENVKTEDVQGWLDKIENYTMQLDRSPAGASYCGFAAQHVPAPETGVDG